TTTDTSITQGVTTQVTVASAAGFRVGMSVVFWQGSQPNLSTWINLAPRVIITTINGNTLTLSKPIDCSFTGVTNMSLAFITLLMRDDCRVYDLNFDGNRANWNLFSRWECVVELQNNGSRTLVQGVKITEAAGEGIDEGWGDDQTVRDCTLLN